MDEVRYIVPEQFIQKLREVNKETMLPESDYRKSTDTLIRNLARGNEDLEAEWEEIKKEQTINIDNQILVRIANGEDIDKVLVEYLKEEFDITTLTSQTPHGISGGDLYISLKEKIQKYIRETSQRDDGEER